ncbi:MAG: cysteine desulfurase [Bacteroidia bacterium]|nr:cysteine desulfurase [Bacteroidia bacterium]
MHPLVISEINNVMQDCFGNPSSIHAEGRKAKTLIEDSRRKIATLLGCAPGEIFFTSSGTEADNMAIRKSVEDLGVKNIITSAIEHHAVLHTIEDLVQNGKVTVQYVNLNENGHVDLQHLELLLSNSSNNLVSLMHCNNEIGNLLNIEIVGDLCKQYNALFHCDTVQTIGHQPIDLEKLNITFLAASAHKFNGPKGVGFIYINHNVKIHPLLTGGSQERNMRGGTENVYGIVGMAKALEIAVSNMDNDKSHLLQLKEYFIKQLQHNIPGVLFNGDAQGQSAYTILNVSFPPTPVAEMFLFKLDMAGICASGGSACSSGTDIGSHVLNQLSADKNRPAVRFSFGYQNTTDEVDYVIGKLSEIYNSQNSNK